jgi:hypothetical protein
VSVDRSRVGRNNRLRSRGYENNWAVALRPVFPAAERVERSGAGKYVKGDLRRTYPLHFSLRSGLSLNWRKALQDAADEVAGRPELEDYLPAAGLTDRSGTRLKHYVLMEREDFVRYSMYLREIGGS